jgi:hypothetical protein
MLWYEPTPELLALLPAPVGNQIKTEYESIQKDEKAPSCHYFEACRNIKGKVYSCTAYPNPATNELKVALELEEERMVSISITDISGKAIKTVAEQKPQGKGMLEYEIAIGELKEGIYLILVETDKGERIVQRIIKK